ncbi:MAG: cytochrome ubiquinol oxidase subunit I, partial [Treponema sp.]|nr:cytochrome ubiquinol oxidase subunit I [Treponema sp.]
QKKLVKFLGKLFLVNFAMGVASGIVQEFQFGMNWSEYARYVGDIFGAPLAIEALLAFFIESTFLGLWVFGWDKLSKKVHLACIWLVAFGTSISALWILAANSFMQSPPLESAFRIVDGRAQLHNIFGLFTPHVLYQYLHVFSAALTTAGFFVLGITAYQIAKGRDTQLFGKAFKQGAAFACIGIVALFTTGVIQAGFVAGPDEQPMKMAAADALWDTPESGTENNVYWPIIAIPNKAEGKNTFEIPLPIPGVMKLLFHGGLFGINNVKRELQEKYADTHGTPEFEAEYGKVDYVPNVWIVFYVFRFMMAAGALMLLMALLAVLWRKDETLQKHPKFLGLLLPAMLLPYIANTSGWILAEMGRQPWVVYGLQTVNEGVSKVLRGGASIQVLISLLGFTVIYSVLTGIAITLVVKITREGLAGITTKPATAG